MTIRIWKFAGTRVMWCAHRGRVCKYAAVVSKGGWDREHYYSDPEFRKEAKKISPNLGRIIRMFLIKP